MIIKLYQSMKDRQQSRYSNQCTNLHWCIERGSSHQGKLFRRTLQCTVWCNLHLKLASVILFLRVHEMDIVLQVCTYMQNLAHKSTVWQVGTRQRDKQSRSRSKSTDPASNRHIQDGKLSPTLQHQVQRSRVMLEFQLV